LLLGYLMGWIKSLLIVNDVDHWLCEFEKYANDDISKQYLELIKSKGFFYWFERLSLKHKIYSLEEFIEYWWDCFQRFNHTDISTQWEQWKYVDVGKLFVDYDNIKDDWKETFDMTSYIDYDSLQDYYKRNLDIFSQEFDMTFEVFKNRQDWKGLLYKWVKTKI
jgi:hypothetical protein